MKSAFAAVSILALTLSAPMSVAPESPAVAAPPKESAARAPALNHVYVVLDQVTFDAMRTSSELADLLGRSDGGLPDYAPPAANADRVFFRGRNTYLEFFAPANRFEEPVGKVGIGIGEDRPSDFAALEQRWRIVCGMALRRSTAEWRRSQPPIPWYESIQCDGTATGSNLAVWAMIYRPEFHNWQSGSPSAPARTSRADILRPRAADGQGRFDITGVTINVTSDVFEKLVPQLEIAGFHRQDTLLGTSFRGNAWELTLRTVDTAPGLSRITLSTQNRQGHELSLGSAALAAASDGGAELRF